MISYDLLLSITYYNLAEKSYFRGLKNIFNSTNRNKQDSFESVNYILLEKLTTRKSLTKESCLAFYTLFEKKHEEGR